MGDSVKIIKEKIGFIGGGNMAKAICEGITKKGLINFEQVYVSGPNIENLIWWQERGANVTTENGKVVQHADVIFLAMKPHILPIAIANVHETLTVPVKSKLFVSVLAGIPLQQLQNVLGPLEENARIIRVMPNTPMLVGEGCTAFCPGAKATPHDIDLVKTVLEVSGVCKQVPESMINAIGALAGSGPAFIYLVIEALADAGVKQGIPRQMAIEMAAQTTLGAAKMVLATGRHTAVLRDEVCSPGGTTITGVHALESGGVRASLINAVEAATKRSQELGEKKSS
ncbi:pyrroline-5-carboxylate reductase 3-like [Sitophilus oryzae]|uniref:Pyrroline-5-carboxylate reductase n=1 Tax=Sitophilus oryzae TaxID=7048 RepID=A0A6J2XT79_SITOR|nr:pyrroline-5-carboxylate reductase 3-like [Sitophilus oryzae]